MTKLKYLHKKFMNLELDEYSFSSGFQTGFKEAFEMISERLAEEKQRLDQYPMMGERIQAINNYQNKMQELLKEML